MSHRKEEPLARQQMKTSRRCTTLLARIRSERPAQILRRDAALLGQRINIPAVTAQLGIKKIRRIFLPPFSPLPLAGVRAGSFGRVTSERRTRREPRFFL